MQGLVRGHLLDGDLDVAEDGLEHVVEIVRHAAGEAADGLQLLRVRKLGLQGILLFFGAELLGDVALDGDEVDDMPGGVAHRRDGGLFGEQRAVLALVDDLAFPGQAGLQGFPHLAVERRVVQAALEEARGLAEDFFAGVSGDPGEGGVHVEDGAGGVGDEDHFAGLLDGADQAFALGLGALARGDVGDEPFQRDHAALFVVDAFALFPDPFDAAVAGGDFVFRLERAVFPEDVLPFFPQALAVGRQDEIVERKGPVPDQVLRRVAGQVLASLADEFHGPAAVVLAAIGHAGQVRQQRDVAPPVLPQFVRGELALGDVGENARELAGGRPEGRHFEMAAQRRGEIFEESGQAGADHVAVGLDPFRFELGHGFPGGLADEVRRLQSRHALEGGIHREEPVVDRFPVVVADDLVQGEAFEHVLEEGAVILLGALALGDVAGDAMQLEVAGLLVQPEADDGFGDDGGGVLAGLAQFEGEERPGGDLAPPVFGGVLVDQLFHVVDLPGDQGIGQGAGHDLFGGVAAQGLDRRAHVDETQGFGVHDPDHVLHAFRQHAVFPFAFAQGFFGLHAGGDVDVGAPIAGQASLGVPDRNPGAGDPDGFARLGHHGVDLVGDGFAAPEEFQPQPLELFPVRFRTQVVEMHPAHHLLGPIADDGFGHAADRGVDPLEVEFPGDGSVLLRQPVEPFHGCGQGFFGELALGDVAGGAVQLQPPGPLVLPEVADRFGDDDGAVLVELRDFLGEEGVGRNPARPVFGDGGADPFHDFRALVRGEGSGHRLGHDFRGRQAAQGFDRRAHVEEAARLDVRDPDDVLHVLRQHAVLLLVFAQRFFGAHAFGDVDVGADHDGGGLVRGVEQHLPAGPDPRPGAVLAAHAEPVVEKPAGGFQIGGQIAPRGLPVAGMDQVEPQGVDRPPLRRQLEFARRVAQQAEVFRAAPDPFRRVVVFPRAGVRRLDQRRVAVGRHLVFLEQPGHALFVALALGDVGFGPPIAPRPSLGILQRDAGGGDPDGFARLRHQRTGRSLDGLAPRGQRESRGLVGLPALFRIQIVEVLPADQFLRAVAQHLFGRVAHVDVKAVDVGFPRDDAVLPRQQAEVVRAFGQLAALFVQHPGQVFAAMDVEIDDDRAGQRDGQPGQQHHPAEMVRMLGEERLRRADGDGIRLAEREDGPRQGPRVGQARRQLAGDALRGARGDRPRRFAGTQQQQVQRDLAVLFRRFAEETPQEGLRIHGRHGEPLGHAPAHELPDRAEDQDLGLLAGGAGQGREHVGGADQTVVFSRFEKVAHGLDGGQVAAGRQSVFRERRRRFHVADGIMDRTIRGRDRLAGSVGFPNAVLGSLPASFADRLLEGGSIRGFHGGHPGPGHHFRHVGQVPGIAPEFLDGDVFAALDEARQAFELRKAQAHERVQDALGLDLGQRGEGFFPVVVLDPFGHPARRQGQHQSGANGQPGFQISPGAPARTGRMHAPLFQPIAPHQDDQQRERRQRRDESGSENLRAPLAGLDVDAHDGGQLIGLRVDHRHERADPRAPAVRGRPFGRGDARVEYAVQGRRGLGVELAGRRGVRDVVVFGIRLEIHDAVAAATHQVDPFPVGIDLLGRHQLALQAAVFRLLLVGAVAVQDLQAVQRDGLRHPTGLFEEFAAHAPVFAADRPPGEHCPERQQDHDGDPQLPADEDLPQKRRWAFGHGRFLSGGAHVR